MATKYLLHFHLDLGGKELPASFDIERFGESVAEGMENALKTMDIAADVAFTHFDPDTD
jgi:hypothetical protein